MFVCVYKGNSATTEEFKDLEEAREKHPDREIQRMRVCTKCNHPECPFCNDWCDVLIGEDMDACCDGKCTHTEEKPYERELPPGKN